MRARRVCLSAVVVAVMLASCGGGDGSSSSSTSTSMQSTTTTEAPTTTASSTKECSVTVGENSGENNRCDVTIGDDVRIVVVNPNADDEMHLHGYDLSTGEMAAGVSSTISFTADVAGEFELESHIDNQVAMILVVSE